MAESSIANSAHTPDPSNEERIRNRCQRACFTVEACRPGAPDACPMCRVADSYGDLLAALKDMRIVLENIRKNDETEFNHHQKRKYDGKLPEGGTRWLEPREMAHSAIKRINPVISKAECHPPADQASREATRDE